MSEKRKAFDFRAEFEIPKNAGFKDRVVEQLSPAPTRLSIVPRICRRLSAGKAKLNAGLEIHSRTGASQRAINARLFSP
jgi:hypothetical protein